MINCDGILDELNTVNECGFCEDDVYTCNVNAGQRIIPDCQNQAITPEIPADAYDLLMSTDFHLNFKGLKTNCVIVNPIKRFITPKKAKIDLIYGTEWYSLRYPSKDLQNSIDNTEEFLRYKSSSNSNYQYVMSKKQLGSSVQIFCNHYNTEPVEVKWEYKTPTLRNEPNVTNLEVEVSQKYFDFKTYYRPMFTINQEQNKYREEAAFIPKVVSVNFTDELRSTINPDRTRISERPHSNSRREHLRYRFFHWERTHSLPCSATCGTSIQPASVSCVAKNGTEVHDRYCDPRYLFYLLDILNISKLKAEATVSAETMHCFRVRPEMGSLRVERMLKVLRRR